MNSWGVPSPLNGHYPALRAECKPLHRGIFECCGVHDRLEPIHVGIFGTNGSYCVTLLHARVAARTVTHNGDGLCNTGELVVLQCPENHP